MASSEINSNRNGFLHPFVVATAIWASVALLYALHLSYQLLFPMSQVLPVVFAIWAPFAIVGLVYFIFQPPSMHRPFTVGKPTPEQLAICEARLKPLLKLWIGATILETIASGGLPIIWSVTHSAKQYYDYGIPSVHGFVMSLFLALTLCYFLLYLLTGEKKYLKFPVFAIFWTLVLITRGTMVYLLLEFAVLSLRIKRIRAKLVAIMVGAAVTLILVFGVVGDIRSGAESFRELAEPTASYPSWSPSGILWAYVYITTSINNLTYTLETSQPVRKLLLPNTLAPLFPTVIRNTIYGSASQAAEVLDGNLPDFNFVASTAYVGPAEDFGIAAIFGFSLVVALVCNWYWYKCDMRSQLIFAVLMLCLILSSYFDLFLSLPIITQIFWFAIIFRKRFWMSLANRRLSNA